MKKIDETVAKYMAIAQAYFHPRVMITPSIKYEKRGTTAGYAFYDPPVVDFNMAIYRENTEEFLARTVPHEVAHIVAYQIMGEKGKGHGYWWKFVMEQVFKIPAKRCHSYDVNHLKTRQIRRDWVYQCNCRTHILSTIKHNKFQKGVKYLCNSCRGTLIYIGDVQSLEKKAA